MYLLGGTDVWRRIEELTVVMVAMVRLSILRAK